MNDANPNQPQEPREILEGLVRRVRILTVAVTIMAMALFLVAGAVFGSLVNYFAGDPLLFGGVAVGCALLGFAFGWFARKRA